MRFRGDIVYAVILSVLVTLRLTDVLSWRWWVVLVVSGILYTCIAVIVELKNKIDG